MWGRSLWAAGQIQDIVLSGTTAKTTVTIIAAGPATVDVASIIAPNGLSLKKLVIDGTHL